jgi:hypothetical protein
MYFYNLFSAGGQSILEPQSMTAAQAVADGKEEESGLPQDKKVAERGQ